MTLTIPGVERVHPREAWEDPALPINDPPSYVPPRSTLARIDQTVIHYPWADVPDDPDQSLEALIADVAAWLRAVQRDWRTRKGYSIGYWWAIDWLGGVWQLRGREYKSAANHPGNDHTAPILMLVDWDGAATDYALAAARAVQADDERHCILAGGRPFEITKSHSNIATGPDPVTLPPQRVLNPGASGCCGDGMRHQLAAGLFDPHTTTGDNMIHYLTHRRHWDSRQEVVGGRLLAGNAAYRFGPFGAEGVPDDATGVHVNLTTTNSAGVGWLEQYPGVSIHNHRPDDNRNTAVWLELDADGTFLLTVAAADTGLIVDVLGYST